VRAPSLKLLLASAALAACGDGAAGGGVPDAPAPPPPRQVIVALDLSGSQRPEHLTRARATLDLVIDELRFGDRIVLLQVHQRSAAEGDAVRWTETAPAPDGGRPPTSLDRERLEAVRQATRSVARAIFEDASAGRLATTDLFSTLHIAGEYVRDAGQRPTALLLLSDMLQSAHGIEMARRGGVPDAEWIETQAQAGLLPRLAGVCVSVVGADATTADGVAVREFWKSYLDRSGATLPERNYRLIATEGGLLGCD